MDAATVKWTSLNQALWLFQPNDQWRLVLFINDKLPLRASTAHPPLGSKLCLSCQLTTFTQVLIPRPDSHPVGILAWSLVGFPSDPLPFLHSFSTRIQQKPSPKAGAFGPLLLLPLDCCFASFHCCRLPWPWDTHLLQVEDNKQKLRQHFSLDFCGDTVFESALFFWF